MMTLATIKASLAWRIGTHNQFFSLTYIKALDAAGGDLSE